MHCNICANRVVYIEVSRIKKNNKPEVPEVTEMQLETKLNGPRLSKLEKGR